MNNDKTGGPAFGQVVELRCVHVDPFGATDWEPEAMLHGGLTVRDYFAGKALCGIEASQGNNGHFISTVQKVAARAYELADAMIEARRAASTEGEARDADQA